LRLFIEQSKETIEDHVRLLQPLAIIGKCLAQSVYDCVKTGGLEPLELVVLEVDVMNYFAEFAQTFDITQAESFDHRFKRTVLAMMRELSAEHVERNCVWDCLALPDKIESGMFIDELLDQPGGSKTVDMYVAPSYPAT